MGKREEKVLVPAGQQNRIGLLHDRIKITDDFHSAGEAVEPDHQPGDTKKKKGSEPLKTSGHLNK
jgi:hypothetical protein